MDTDLNPRAKEVTEANPSFLKESSVIAPTILNGNILTSTSASAEK